MIRPAEKLLITFRTTTDAMAMEQHCRQTGTAGRLVPVPGRISTGCGLAWAADPEAEAVLRQQLAAWGIEAQGFYRCLL